MSVLRPQQSSSYGTGPRATLYAGAPSIAAGMSRFGSSATADAVGTTGAPNGSSTSTVPTGCGGIEKVEVRAAEAPHADAVGLCELCAARRKCGKFGCLRPIGNAVEGFCPLHVPAR
jgi:hypothetical protein